VSEATDVAKIAVFIDHDIMIRHFVQNGVLAPLEREHDVVYVFPENKRVNTDPSTLGLPRFRTVAVSSERAYLYRRLYVATVLRRLRHTRDKRVLFRFWWQMLGNRHFLESWLYSWPVTHGFYKRRMLARIGDNPALDTLLAEERPDLIIHPTVLEGLFVSDLVRWGQAHGVPTVYLMNSWDNPAVKAILLGPPDRLVVWGEHSRQLACDRLGVPLDRILSFGAAQFDVYRRPPRETRERYRARLGVARDLPILLYAGSSKGLNETRHLEVLEDAIERGRLPPSVVLYRPHPWRAKGEGEEDFFTRSWRHVMMAPDMAEYYRRAWKGEQSIYFADYEETHVTLNAVDAVVSPLSTILLEAARLGKPIAAYLPEEDLRSNLHMFTVMRTVHYREFFERVDCLRIEARDALVSSCAELLRRTSVPGLADALQAQCEYFVSRRATSYAEQLRGLAAELTVETSRDARVG
jgi:hypothetical protein